ncbi:hypothetical protein [Methanolobus psychrotolerans]|uniref:hypothetical protein n=1 Tax=Methanolobus psychrotolerans TaxID=1874706 RepID=UPI000B916D2D|nr:hypothetical protein [Methanolobus psychrotolerans]
MTFEPKFLDKERVKRVDSFLDLVDIAEWYKNYSWNRDTWKSGFPEILKLEIAIGGAAKNNAIDKSHLIQIAEWGRLRDPHRVELTGNLDIPFYDEDTIFEWVERYPGMHLDRLSKVITGFGPTYSTKLLRFAVPSEFGALDTRLVRVFGRGDSKNKKIDFLKLAVQSSNGGSIKTSRDTWPSEYAIWINILRYIAHKLNDSSILCPHPEGFVEAGLREDGIWQCADVEMALFSYATHCIYSGK